MVVAMPACFRSGCDTVSFLTFGELFKRSLILLALPTNLGAYKRLAM